MPILLYSTNSHIAYEIAERFYGGRHFVWCVPNCEASHAAVAAANPESSDPFRIYRQLAEAVRKNDQHCTKFDQNRIGMLRGAEEHLKRGSIGQEGFNTIVEMIEHAKIADFAPLLYIIPYGPVEDRVAPTPPGERANVLSREFKIPDLASAEFDAVSLP